MTKILLIGLGGGLGAISRYLVVVGVQGLLGGLIFPFGTFVVNMTGCLIIGFLAAMAESRGLFTGDLRAFVFVGILGGYTTFSSFGYETVQLLRDGEVMYASLNAVGQLVLGITCVWLGSLLARML